MVHNIFVSMESEEIVGIPIQFHGDVGRLFPMNHPKQTAQAIPVYCIW